MASGLFPKPRAQCPRCGKWKTHTASLANYQGDLVCEDCGCTYNVRFQWGFLLKSAEIRAPSDVDLPSPPVPQGIHSDLLEAGVCLSARSAKAVVILCRRALEGAALKLSAKGKTLFHKIEDLYKRELIPRPLYDAATEIRVFGNYGAHPTNDLLADIDLDLAKEVLYFTREVLDDLFVKPGRLKDLHERRRSRKKNSD